MPHSPLTRILAVLIVVLLAFLFLWPGETQSFYGSYLLGALILIVGAFTWNVVRGASPFHEHGFHRTLPGGPREAFRRVLGIHGIVFGAILLILLAHAAINNVRWRDLVYTVVNVFLPLTALCGLVGIMASLGSSGERKWRIPAWLAVFAAWLLSASLMGTWLRQHPAHSLPPHYLSGWRSALLSAAILFPFLWWLTAVCRRRLIGLLGTASVAALLPWIINYANFLQVPESFAESPVSPLSASRKPLEETARDWPEVTDMLEFSGLGEGDFGEITSLTFKRTDERSWPRGRQTYYACWFGEVAKESRLKPENWGPDLDQARLKFGKSGGQIVWGESGIFQHLRTLLPAHESFEPFEKPRFPVGASSPWPETKWVGCLMHEPPEVLASQPWNLRLEGPQRWDLIGNCKTASGGRIRLPQGGVLHVKPLIRSYSIVTLDFSYSGAALSPDYPWFGEPGGSGVPQELMLVLIDESGKQAFALGSARLSSRTHTLLGRRDHHAWTRSIDDSAREELLARGTLYLFQAVPSRTAFKSLDLLPP